MMKIYLKYKLSEGIYWTPNRHNLIFIYHHSEIRANILKWMILGKI